jgi:hypothetical protein
MTIDIEQFKGHTPGPWHRCDDGACGCNTIMTDRVEYVAKTLTGNDATSNLIASAPALLAEVIRLREQLLIANEVLTTYQHSDDPLVSRDCKQAIELINAVKEVTE